jgi:hypothetical protein
VPWWSGELHLELELADVVEERTIPLRDAVVLGDRLTGIRFAIAAMVVSVILLTVILLLQTIFTVVLGGPARLPAPTILVAGTSDGSISERKRESESNEPKEDDLRAHRLVSNCCYPDKFRTAFYAPIFAL